jgi:hypothetical protein
MKKILFRTAIIISFFLTAAFIPKPSLYAQDTPGNNEPGTYSWITTNDEATWNLVWHAFIGQYGEERTGWPPFIGITKDILADYQQFLSKKKNPNPRYHVTNYFSEKLQPGSDPGNRLAFRETHTNTIRNYYALLDYFFGLSEWNSIKEKHNAREKTFFDAATADSVLVPILFKYAGSCPAGMLEWYFSEVFPVVDLLYQQNNINEVTGILADIKEHTNKLYHNYEFVKAGIWLNTFYKFTTYYDLQYIRPEVPEKLYQHHLWYEHALAQQFREEAIAEFKITFANNLVERLDGMSTSIRYSWVSKFLPDNTLLGTLTFDMKKEGRTIEKLLDGYGHFLIDENFKELYHDKSETGLAYKQSYALKFPLYFTLDDNRWAEVFPVSIPPVIQDEITVLRGKKQHVGSVDIDERGSYREGEQEFVFVFCEESLHSLAVVFIMPHMNYLYLDVEHSEGQGHWNVPYNDAFAKKVQQQSYEALVDAARQVFGSERVMPVIRGLGQHLKMKAQALKASATPRNVKADGKSQVEISAVLYEYIPYSKEPGRPLAGEVLHFSIQESGGVKAGSLSSATAVTDANGMARVMFTAPDNALLGQLQQWARNSTSVKVRSEAHKQEDIAYIGFRSDRSKVFAEPAPGIVSEHCIVPPDRRFPAVIRAYVEDPDMNPLPYTEVLFSIREDNPAGMLRDAGGHEGTQLRVLTDAGGWAAVQYYYAAFGPPPEARTETIEISTKNMSTPMEARVSTGLNLIFESLENAYEGKGIINAGEQIPLRVKIKDAWHPGLNLEEILSFWGPGGVAGEEMLFAKLEVEPLSSVPVYLLDQLKLEQYPGQGFSENMRIRSFKDKGQMNMLWMPDYGLHDYQGYPRIRPMTAGTHYYTAILSLVDDKGQEVFRSRHPARQAHFNLQTGLAADALQIFFISNPFAPHSPEARLLLTTLDLMGFGTVMSVVNALDAINRGATDELYGLLFAEIKGAMLDKVKEGSAYKELAVDLYTGMALAEKLGLEIMKDQTGPLAAMDAAILARLKETFSMGHRQLLVLYGDGQQRLFAAEEGEAGREIPVQEGVYVEDQGGEISSLKNGHVSIFLIPEGMEVDAAGSGIIKKY